MMPPFPSSALRAAVVVLALAPAGAGAQTPPAPPTQTAPTTPTPPAAPATPPSRAGTLPRESGLFLSAVFGGNGGPIRSGLVWRIYSDPSDGSDPQLLSTTDLPTPVFNLDPGAYIVHASFGLASATKRIVMGASAASETLVVNGGGLVLGAVINDTQIPSNRLRFSVYVPLGNDPEGRAVASDVPGGQLIRLPEGTYRVVSTYGDSNAIANADLRVEAGKVTEATLRHRAATVTLKLVAASGSEALANTSFSVLTPGGDTIREAIGAFPSMTLAEGEYIVIARNGGKVYTQEFSVKAGLDRDIEVIVKP
ncbi:hypothetical protein [Alsobacter sp. R-9]